MNLVVLLSDAATVSTRQYLISCVLYDNSNSLYFYIAADLQGGSK